MQIGGWDYTTSSCTSDYRPVFYFIPDYEFISYIRINGMKHIPVKIENTQIYDGNYWICVDRQPNTEWHMGFLDNKFSKYPQNNGNVRLNLPSIKILKELTCVLNDCC